MKNHELWKNIAENWKHHCSPGTPSVDEQKIYEQFMLEALEGKSTKRVLVLGATPEIRNVIVKHPDIEVTILDQNMEMILAMTELMPKRNTNEKWVKGDWLTTDFFDSYFDVVMGDLVICNIVKDNQKTFLSQVKKFLKPDGYWVSRIYSICEYTEFKTIAELLEEYEDVPEIGDFEISEFLRQAGITCWNPETKHIELINLGKELEDLMENKKIMEKLSPKKKQLITGIYKLFAPFNIQFFIDKEEETDKILAENFLIENKIENVWARQFKEKGYFMYKLQNK